MRAAESGSGRRDRDRRPRLLPARASRDPGDVQPPRDLRHRPVRRGGRGGALRRTAVEVPGVRGVEGRSVRQHPGRPRGGGEDRDEADPAVRLGRGAAGPRRRAPREAEGQRPGVSRSAGAEQGAGADRHRPVRWTSLPRTASWGSGTPTEVRRLFTSLEFRSLLDRLQEVGVHEAEGRGHRARPPRGHGRRARRDDRRRTPRRACDWTRICARCAAPRRRREARRRRSRRWPRWARWPTRWRPRTRRSGRTTRRSSSAGRSPRACEVARRGVRHVPRRVLARSRRGRVPAARAEREVPRRRRAGSRSRTRTKGSCSATPAGGRSRPTPPRSRCSRR